MSAPPERQRGPAATAAEAGMSDKKWYVIHTYSGHENKVKTNLEKAIHSAGLDEQFGQILVMTEEVVEMKDGKRKTSKRKTRPTPTVQFNIGDHVRITDGPFSAFAGVVDEVNNERGKVKVMVSIFGRA